MVERRAPQGRATSVLPRWSLAAPSALHGLLFGWAALVLPWQRWTLVAVLTAGHAALHLLIAALAVARHRWLGPAWRLQSFAALAYLGYLGWGLLSAAWTLQAIYVGLGQGLAAALAALFGLFALATVPLAGWGIMATGGLRWSRAGQASLVLVLGVGGATLGQRAQRVKGESLVDEATAAQLEALLPGVVGRPRPPSPAAPLPSPMTTAPATCDQPPSRGLLSLVATYLRSNDGDGRPAATSTCLQEKDTATLATALSRELATAGARGPVKLDLIAGRSPFPGPADGLLASLALRPGLDGVCQGARCLMPWQLVALDSFTRHQPLAMAPDARLGVALPALRAALGSGPDGPSHVIRTRSWVVTARGQPIALSRGLPPRPPVTTTTLTAAHELTSRYVRSAQRRNGRFRYLVHPLTGRITDEPFSVARQAGTTMVACELAPHTAPWRKTVARSMRALSKLERRWDGGAGPIGVMVTPTDQDRPTTKIGPSALTLAALLRCRPRSGHEHDPWIGRLARLLLSQQRDDGTFQHRVSTASGEPVPAVGSLYVDGQVVLALVLLEGVAEPYSASFPPRPAVREAVHRAMDAFGQRYWPAFLRPLLFAEENWHCIAAAAAVGHHGHADYEQLCLDYVTFKGRFIHDELGGSHPDFWGGYGLGNLVPPHNTATAGLGEALAAAIQIRRARGLDSGAEEALLRRILAFLLRAQWQAERCFACAPGITVAGGFSEHLASPPIRIDYVQHAWAALGHGAQALGLWPLPVSRRPR